MVVLSASGFGYEQIVYLQRIFVVILDYDVIVVLVPYLPRKGLAIHCGFNLIAVGSQRLISIYSQDFKKDKHIGELLGSVQLVRHVSESGFLELKFLSESQLFYCDSSSCSLCTTTNKQWTCAALVLSWNGKTSSSLLGVSVSHSSGKLFVRVTEPSRAAVLAYSFKDSRLLQPEQIAPDAPYITGFSTVSGFSRGMYIYFIGSAIQPYEPFINANLGNENRTITKITRICSSDLTSQLESRMDLAIECGFGDDSKRVEASFYDPVHDQVIIVSGSSYRNWTICSYSMSEIEERFDRDWNMCQQATFHDGALNCEAATNAADLDDHCHIFTRKTDAFRMQTCSRFGQDAKRVYENCNLHQFAENSYRYGWLEDFRAVTGNVIGSVAANFEKIVSVLPDFENEAIFLGGYSGLSMLLLRVAWQTERLSSASHVFWKRRTFPTSRFPMCLNGNGKTLFILNSTKVAGKIPSPAFGALMNRDVQLLLPMTSSDVFTRLRKHVLQLSIILLCVLADGTVQDAACNVRVVGRLEGYDGFTLEVKKTTHSVALMTDLSQHTKSPRTWKEVVAILAVVLILAVLGVIICLARKKMRKTKDGVSVAVSSSNFGEDAAIRRHFGIVSRATYNAPDGTTKKVACKILKQSIASVSDFITEGLTMDRFNHPNLMQLIGIAFTDGKIPIIVTDYMENGDLRTYLRDDSKVITLRSLLRFACQIAEGMKHLHMCRSVHCDLAARNCIFASPVFWHNLKPFTFQNDVWAYGVVLWELTTRGLTPYAGKKGIEIMEFLRSNKRLQMPEYCPAQLVAKKSPLQGSTQLRGKVLCIACIVKPM
ncbi:protein tyrosine kinase [Ancylostoma ceylanicum]|uniref:Protein tyrosine kinase n=1 Tax=Ancylostoma ceylanicum TaxID=53326 RepID=A0A0D6LB69_9BILA|nr:protein tyrosine kinase [Ancylostoma ceylanicum]